MKPLGFRAMLKEQNNADRMPKKSVRKWKKKDRQKAKKQIREEK
jgi:hypothetical protein